MELGAVLPGTISLVKIICEPFDRGKNAININLTTPKERTWRPNRVVMEKKYRIQHLLTNNWGFWTVTAGLMDGGSLTEDRLKLERKVLREEGHS